VGVSYRRHEATKLQRVATFQFCSLWQFRRFWQSLRAKSFVFPLFNGFFFALPRFSASGAPCRSPDLPLCSFVSFVVKGFVYSPVTLSPHPTPLTPLLLQTKGKVAFDWTVDRAVETFFRVFSTSNRVQFFWAAHIANLLFS
jgi:hypothetical protein